MIGWVEYVLALALFFASHFLPRVGGMRERLIGTFGRRAYFSVYGLLSIVLLVWVIGAAGRAPFVELWPQQSWTRWATNLAMPVAVILTCCGIGMVQPFTLGGRRGAEFDPDRPGFAAVSRHPLFVALALWAASHLLPNGDLAHAILFGSFLAMTLAAIPAFDAKARRSLPRDAAAAYFASTSVLSLAPLASPPWLRANGRRLAFRAIIGLALWLALAHLHAGVIGASPFPL